MSAILKKLFRTLEFDSSVADGEVLSILHKNKNNSLIFQLALKSRVPYSVLSETADKIRNCLNSGVVSIYPKYSPELFSVDGVWDIINVLRSEGENINGYFDDAEIRINGDKVEIELKYIGAQILLADNIDGKIKKFAKGFFGKSVDVVLSGQTEFNMKEYEVKLAEELASLPVPPPAPPPSVSDAGYSSSANMGGGYVPQEKPQRKTFSRDPVIHEPPETMKLMFTHSAFRDEADLVMGKPINEPPVPISSLVSDADDVTIWGEIFGREEKTIKDGQFTIIMVSITDRTSSQILKIFTKTEKAKSYSFFKVGSTVLVNGKAKYDNFEKALLLEPKSAMLVKTIAKADTAEVKRVELHMHSNMSDMDAVTPPADLINQAYKWGHPAVAITDHGNVQAYPEVMGAWDKIKKNDPDSKFKVIYGMEAYFVNDESSLIEGCTGRSVDDDIIIFDLETTGLKRLMSVLPK